MKSMSIIDLLYAIEGDIKPEAETNIDTKRLQNLSAWTDVNYEIIGKLLDVANSSGLMCYSSAEHIVKESRKHLKDMYEWIGTYINEWNGNENND